MTLMQTAALAAGAGLCAAMASVCAKISVDVGTGRLFCAVYQYAVSTTDECLPVGDAAMAAMRAVSFLTVFGFNACMWSLFTRSLQSSASSIYPTIINSTSNFIFTAVMGRLMFGEVLSGRWWMGAMLIIAGTLLVHRGTAKATIIDKKSKTKAE